MSNPAPRQLFVTTALPYANAAFHIGHIMEYIQADIWVRFQRMQGHEVHFVCADDAHGAPIMIAAEKAGVTPQEFVARIAAGRQQHLDGFHIGFDNWSSTDSPENHQLSQEIYRRLRDDADLITTKTIEQFYDPVKEMFLADRYIKGTCPKCGAKDQYGDSCEVCGAVYAPTDLIEPYSALSGAVPVMKSSEHYFFRLSDAKCVDFLRQWALGDARLQVIALADNRGGAGGFAEGMRQAVAQLDPDWILVMDDDARPEAALQRLRHLPAASRRALAKQLAEGGAIRHLRQLRQLRRRTTFGTNRHHGRGHLQHDVREALGDEPALAGFRCDGLGRGNRGPSDGTSRQPGPGSQACGAEGQRHGSSSQL